jgi:uncharacterized protein
MVQSRTRRIAFRILRFLAVLYAAMILTACLSQRRLIYRPEKLPLQDAINTAAAAGFQPWRNAAGEYIGWCQTNPGAGERSRLLIVHGNSGSAVDRLDYAEELKKIGPWDVYILEYPGYGPRPGKPTQTSLFAAADEAIALLESNGPIYLMGESLGTGVACYLAGSHPKSVRGMLLIAPYNNLTDVAGYQFPILPVKWFLLDRYPSETYLKNYNGPVAIVLAGQDRVIPQRFGRKLYDGYPGPKRVWEVPQAGHNDLMDQPAAWWRELDEFWKQNAK